MDFVAFIFARGGSKGLPDKNIKILAGKPLIAWSIEHAKSIPLIRRVIVSTDSKRIAEVAREFGAEVPFLRPSELAQDDSPEWASWQHAVQFLSETEGMMPDGMVSIPCTSPLRSVLDIENCLLEFKNNKPDAVITVSDAHRNPWFNMVKLSPEGYSELVIPPNDNIFRRQDAPHVFDMTTVAYVVKPSFILSNTSIFSGQVRAVKVPPDRAMDIDTQFDFDIAEFLMNRKIGKL